MSTEFWKLDNDLCRCCHSEGNFKILDKPQTFSGVTEIYTDMLKDCFSISVLPMLSVQTYTICETCITRLRDAWEFKKQVDECEKKLKDLYEKKVALETSVNKEANLEIKLEIVDAVEDDREPTANDDFKDDFTPDEDEDFEDPMVFQCNEKAALEVEDNVNKKKTKKNKPCRTVKQKKHSKNSKNPEDTDKKHGKMVSAKFRLQEMEDYKRDGDTYHCSRCDKKYEKFFSLRFHIKTKHYKIPRFICPICQEGFHTPAPLTVHKLRAHDIDDRFNCNACKGTFNTKVQLRKHINNFHMLGERYKCEFCDYESFSFEGLYKHKYKHRTSKDFHCKYCRKSFLRKTTLDLHERIHTGDRRKVCSVCGQAFVQKASLNYHMAKYHPEVNF